MASKKTSSLLDARRRAREAKAKLDAERAEHDRKVEQATTDYYLAHAEVERLQAELDTATAARDTQVRALLDLGETTDRVATLTGLTSRDIAAARRAAKTEPAEDQPADQTASA
jgi:hypothetical protein